MTVKQVGRRRPSYAPAVVPTDLSLGILLGLLIGEGSFGGDGKQPHVTLRMHTRHVDLFDWLQRTFPAGRLYGPYNHGGRRYFQWMARGAFLREELAPLIAQHLSGLDGYAAGRFEEMCARYHIELAKPEPPGPAD